MKLYFTLSVLLICVLFGCRDASKEGDQKFVYDNPDKVYKSLLRENELYDEIYRLYPSIIKSKHLKSGYIEVSSSLKTQLLNQGIYSVYNLANGLYYMKSNVPSNLNKSYGILFSKNDNINDFRYPILSAKLLKKLDTVGFFYFIEAKI